MPKKIDLTGQRFGRLVVTGEAPPKYTSGGNRKVCWYADCDCGTKHKIFNAGALRSGYTLSCGCWNIERLHQPKYYNRNICKYDLSGEFGIGITAQNDEFWFDKEDYDLIKNYSWHKHHNYFEASGKVTEDEPNTIYLHRLIMGNPEKKYDVDHIKTENKFDNRKCNLRIVSRLQNNRNHRLFSQNTSGVSGVRWHSRDLIWEAWIRLNYKDIYLGRYKNFEDAVKARKEAEDKYYGEFSYDNSQKIAQQYMKGVS